MLAALLRFPAGKRPAVARVWARRAHASHAENRRTHGVDADTLRRRADHDARGQIEREGCSYDGAGHAISWSIRRSVRGRVNQVDVVVDGKHWRTCSRRALRRLLGRSTLG